MKIIVNKLNKVLITSGVLCCTFIGAANAAIALDRTRAIFPGSDKSITMTIRNDSPEKAYLAQAWLEDANGRKIASPLVITPALQRVEPGTKSVVQVKAAPDIASLPQDRESLFYFSVREVPPKSDRSNVMQIALQTRIKLFYRPAGIIPDRFSQLEENLILHSIPGGYRVENPTPYYMTIIGIRNSEKEAVRNDFKALMIAPKSSATVMSGSFARPYVTTINDYGGKPGRYFNCNAGVCKAEPVKK
ncbi:molecular chaperone [Entomohabitans teleogrylli]|uniref:fimbrial biogenesis chaperone n=1 Tax=Entomohabitans teleogrylli TaxID=1384589 RepID=UPI00073D7FE4|nr:fimbria/pilus periplasmic chaperone [Entomohabitans teleogrylli]